MSDNIALGKLGEKEGVSYLKRLGYQILETNFKTTLGEIDCIAKDRGMIVFVEIKTRQSARYGFPEEAVNREKQRKMIRTAQLYLKGAGLFEKIEARFDVLAIFGSKKDKFTVNHIQNAFEIESKENT